MAIETKQEATFRVADLHARKTTRFTIEPDEEARAAIAADLELSRLRKLRLEGELVPLGRDGWALNATLGATVVQPCVVTLEPVTTRIDEEVRRSWRPVDQLPELGDEAESPEDEGLEPLGSSLPLWDVMVEALALAVPAYPRSDAAELGEAVFTEPGAKPMTDDDAKPFAGLAALRDRLPGGGEDDER